MNIDADGVVGDVPEMKPKTTYRTPEDGTYKVSGRLVEAKTGEVLWEEPQAADSVSKEKPGQAEQCPVCRAPGRIVGNIIKHFERDEQCVEWPSEETLNNFLKPAEGCQVDWADWDAGVRQGVVWCKANTKIRSVDEVRAEYESKLLNNPKKLAQLLDESRAELNDAKAQVKVLREALGFYERGDHLSQNDTDYIGYDKPNGLRENMAGKRAREALKKTRDVG